MTVYQYRFHIDFIYRLQVFIYTSCRDNIILHIDFIYRFHIDLIYRLQVFIYTSYRDNIILHIDFIQGVRTDSMGTFTWVPYESI